MSYLRIPDLDIQQILDLKAKIMADDPSLLETPLGDATDTLVAAYVKNLFPKSHNMLWEATRNANKPPKKEAKIRVTSNNYAKVINTINAIRRLEMHINRSGNQFAKYNQQLLILAAMMQDGDNLGPGWPDYMNVCRAATLASPVASNQQGFHLVMQFLPATHPDKDDLWLDIAEHNPSVAVIKGTSANTMVALSALIFDTLAGKNPLPVDGGIYQLSCLFNDLTKLGQWIAHDWFEQILEGAFNEAYALGLTDYDQYRMNSWYFHSHMTSPLTEQWVQGEPLLLEMLEERRKVCMASYYSVSSGEELADRLSPEANKPA